MDEIITLMQQFKIRMITDVKLAGCTLRAGTEWGVIGLKRKRGGVKMYQLKHPSKPFVLAGVEAEISSVNGDLNEEYEKFMGTW